MWIKRLLSVFLLLNYFPLNSNSAKILSVAFFASKSNYITYETLIEELAKSHEMTVLSPVISGKTIPNMREILTIDIDKIFEQMPNLFEMKINNTLGITNAFHMTEFFEYICTETYKLPQVINLLKEKFDLILMSAVFNECVAGYIYKFNTSLIQISPVSAPSWLTNLLGTPTPTSFVPNLFTNFNQKMNFIERVQNFYSELSLRIRQEVIFKPKMQRIYRKMLNDSSIPSVNEIFMNTSLVLSVSHLSISAIRPFLPDVIEVGGMHCRPAKPLPNDFEKFINSGKDGFIFFSMGSALKGSLMPEKYRLIFLNTFSKLKQTRVIWKWEKDTMPNLPTNVMLSKWAPQQDILGHPKIKLFIMHGGFGSTTEAIYHGSSLLGIPMFGDQHSNMKKNVELGFAQYIDFNSLTEEKLLNAINEIINEPKYSREAKRLSKLFRDQINEPLERALYWTNYVLRHKGAAHLRSPARNLNIIQYYSVDILLILSIIFILSIFITFKITTFLIIKKCFFKKINKPKIKQN